MASLIRFDWAIKRILRNKADYCIVQQGRLLYC